MDVIYYPFSWLLNFFNSFFQDYGLAIIFFGLVVKIVLFPLSLKGKKSMIKTNMLSGKLEQLKKKYGKDQQRYNMEMQKLYKEEGVNPMGGCLWSLLPIFFLIPLYAIIRQPLHHLMGLTPDQMQQIADVVDWGKVAFDNGWIAEVAAKFDPEAGYNQLYLASLITESNLHQVTAALGAETNVFAMDLSFLGVNLSTMPQWKVWNYFNDWNYVGAFLMVLVSTALGFAMSKVSLATNKLSGQAAPSGSSNKIMMWTMPLMSLWIGFYMPAAMCLYWIANSLFSMVQEVIAARMLKKDYEKARLAAEARAKEEKEEEKQRKEAARLERARRAKEDKKGVVPEGVNKEDSREGLRAYARGRAYVPNRYGEVTEYVDPDTMTAIDDKTRKAQEKEALAKVETRMTDKMDLTGLKERTEEAKTEETKTDEESV